MAFFHIFCIAVFAIVALADAFTVPPLFGRRVVPSIKMHFDEALQERTLVNGQLPAERYIATNRFKVRPKSMAKFEKRWADRTSRLALLEGFRFFTLLRRVAMDGDESFREDQAELGNYISLTIWENKGNFDAWRTGEAFK